MRNSTYLFVVVVVVVETRNLIFAKNFLLEYRLGTQATKVARHKCHNFIFAMFVTVDLRTIFRIGGCCVGRCKTRVLTEVRTACPARLSVTAIKPEARKFVRPPSCYLHATKILPQHTLGTVSWFKS
jgi:hypothetical protein